MSHRQASSLLLPPTSAQIAPARRFVRRILAGAVPEAVLNDLELIVSELFTNAVRHGGGSRVRVDVDVTLSSAEVTVESTGPAQGVGPVETWDVASEASQDGRGLGIVRALADVVLVEREHERLAVRATRLFTASGRVRDEPTGTQGASHRDE